MSLKKDIYYLNTRHSEIITEFLYDVQDIVKEVTFFKEDYIEFQSLSNGVIDFHNGLSEYVVLGGVDCLEWYVSLPNNLYWATKGYLSSIQSKEEVDLIIYEEKLLSLTINVIGKLNNSIVIQPYTDRDIKINLN